MSEYTENLGRRVELREEKSRLAAEIDALRGDLRSLCSPILDVDDLNGTKIANLGFSLNGKLERLTAINSKLAAIKEILGR
ncbi:MAG: hypothetical protein ACNI3A_18675 [Desulfovibrio sp.]|uniref:hypothetical protein n=1 Tax=Desulfovibrio sp. 7SRBS1 TaxID=3378064 RepID=UPI003B411CA4